MSDSKRPLTLILCVDDDPDDRTHICELIAEEFPTLKVDEARNGLETLRYLHQANQNGKLPGLIILDINMPKMDGIETLRQVRNETSLSQIPIIIFTTSTSGIDKTIVSYYNVQFVLKPNSYYELRNELKKMIIPLIKQS